MKLHFVYNLDKDIENIVKGMNAVNSKKPTKFQNILTDISGVIILHMMTLCLVYTRKTQ